MNTTKIESLLRQIEAAAMLVCDDSPYLHSVNASEVTGEADNEVLYINWHDDEGQEFVVTITEAGLDGAEVNDNKIVLADHEGERTVILLYNLTPSLVVKIW